MYEHPPSSRGLWIASFLRRAMARQNWTGKDLARALGWSETQISRMLTGHRTSSDVDLAVFLGWCRATPAEIDQVIRIAQADRISPSASEGCRLTHQVAAEVDHHARAHRIIEFAATVLPVPLRTREYDEAVRDARPGSWPQEHTQRGATLEHLLTPSARLHPQEWTFFLHEWVLRTPVGGGDVMAEQLRHLLWLSTTRRFLLVRVVPILMGAHPAMAGSFALLDTADSSPVVVLTEEHATVFVENRVETGHYRAAARRLADLALSEESSREVIGRIAVEFSDRADRSRKTIQSGN